MKTYVLATCNTKTYADNVMGGWKALHAALIHIEQEQVAHGGAGGSSSGAGSSAAGLILPPSVTNSAPSTPPGEGAMIVDLTL